MPHLHDVGDGDQLSLVLRVRGLQKRFGSLRVLPDVDLDLRAGEILALGRCHR